MKKKRKLIKRRLIFLILIIILIICLGKKLNFINSNDSVNVSNITIIENCSNYETIKLDKNENYSGIGQQAVKNKDGYFTTFITIENHKKVYKEYKQNGNSSWANHQYWGGSMADNGCGITAISIILSGYNKNYSPEKLRKKYYPVLDNKKISQELSSTFGIENTDFYYDSAHLSKESLIRHLESNRPILICVWNKPTENRWTSASHYMVLLATDDNMVYISNPNRT